MADNTQNHMASLYGSLCETPEGEILFRLITGNDFSVAKAVEETAAQTSIAAASSVDDALGSHSLNVANAIYELAMLLAPDEQSKLINFVTYLQQVTIPDHENGGELEYEDKCFWTDMPQMSLILADYHASGASYGTEEEQGRHFQNCTAYVAQLSEIGFSFYGEDISWNYSHLQRPVTKESPTRMDARLMCIWLIYAPKKVWLDVQLRRSSENEMYPQQFLPEHWPQWKQFLQRVQQTPSDTFADEETQQLVRRALHSMEKTEAAEPH
ncbi:unnamed protein product [Clonostachys solani]|uniref:Uncharacterized protein n=1 Tax=Clonostachys solani TaxID=160281 RepID=A0A9P0EHG4_9HYPO|nr:unnamed protein product [Clonostachys solani]